MKKIIILLLILGLVGSGVFIENVLYNKDSEIIEPIFLSGKHSRSCTVLKTASGLTKTLFLK